MNSSLRPTDEQIAAAQLRVVLDGKLGRETPEIVQEIAAHPSVADHRERGRSSLVEPGTNAIPGMQDWLTGLPNPGALDARLAELITSPGGHVLSIALIDLDRFKGVNDRLGHLEGDAVLRVVAATLRDALRDHDMVARTGADEFVALLPGTSLADAEATLNRAADVVAALPNALSREVTLSVGVVSLRPKESASQVLARADFAMYVAKRRGGNAVVAHADTPGKASVEAPETGV